MSGSFSRSVGPLIKRPLAIVSCGAGRRFLLLLLPSISSFHLSEASSSSFWGASFLAKKMKRALVMKKVKLPSLLRSPQKILPSRGRLFSVYRSLAWRFPEKCTFLHFNSFFARIS